VADGWPNWSREAALIVGTGPSAVDAPLDLAHGRCKAIVVKSSWHLCPWADVLYGIDKGWWIANQGAPKFKGMKFSPSPTACRAYGLRQVRLKSRAQILVDEPGVLGCGVRTGGGHSGFQAVNLAVQFGARRILLVGFDMTLANGTHWKVNDPGVAKADAGRVNAWREAMDACAPQFEELGVDVINCSMQSALTAYPTMRLSEALQWRYGRGSNLSAGMWN
jgi:hypothetical protein